MKSNRFSVSEAFIKNIAYLSMLIDHFFAVIYYPVFGVNPIYRAGRAIGRPAFVLFAFMAAEGFIHTHSRPKYLLRLFLFAMISEVPFDLAINRSIATFDGQNVFFTLFFGVLALCLMDQAKGHPVLQGVAVCACALCATLLNTDYMLMGVFLIVTFYLCRKDFVLQFVTGALVIYIGIFLLYVYRYRGYDYSLSYYMILSLREMYGLAAFPIIYFYNGQRGRQLPKLCYYLFYPVHLIILYWIGRVYMI